MVSFLFLILTIALFILVYFLLSILVIKILKIDFSEYYNNCQKAYNFWVLCCVSLLTIPIFKLSNTYNTQNEVAIALIAGWLISLMVLPYFIGKD